MFEECAREAIAIPLRKVYGPAAYWRVSVFRWINEVHHGNGNSERKDRRKGLSTRD
jgi:hypothetical protein